jgi:hypothetical protein
MPPAWGVPQTGAADVSPYVMPEAMPGQPLAGVQDYGASPWTEAAIATLTAQAPVNPPWYHALAKPLPLWANIILGIVAALFLAAGTLFGRDWAESGVGLGIVALALAVIVLIATGVRAGAGMAAATNEHRTRQFVGASLVVVLFATLFGAGVGLQNPLHRAQASSLENQGKYQQALDEFSAAGEAAPNSRDLARVYDEWGEAYGKTGDFANALKQYQIVLQNFGNAGTPLIRAQSDAATAYYALAEKDLSATNFKGAVDNFRILTTQFSGAPEAQLAHADFAKALLEVARATLKSAGCGDAKSIYDEITSKFSDTPSADQAKQDLQAPQPVKGKFSAPLPANTTADVFLVKNFDVNMTADQFKAALAGQTTVNSDGSFTFDAIPLGAYDLLWLTQDSAGKVTVGYYVHASDNSPYYVANVAALCGYDFGVIEAPIVDPNQTAVNRGLIALAHGLLR